jgi:hypothetical protein
MDNELKNHIRITTPPERLPYRGTGRSETKIPSRNREVHGAYLKSKFQESWNEAIEEKEALRAETSGIKLEFSSSPGFDLLVKSLEAESKGIKLLNTRVIKDDPSGDDLTTFATVFIPFDKKRYFLKKIENYLNQLKDSRKSNKPRNSNLINSIESVRKAVVESFWTDDIEALPGETDMWCEIWIRTLYNTIQKSFREFAEKKELEVSTYELVFPETAVMLVKVNNDKMKCIIDNYDYVAAFRKAADVSFFVSSPLQEQAGWAKDFVDRLKLVNESDVVICLLDSGVNNGHPLIAPVLASMYCDSVDKSWGVNDDRNHGTLMAGITAYDDLFEKLVSITAPDVETVYIHL